MSKAALELVRKDFFTELPFWQELDGQEKQTVERHTRGIHACLAEAKLTRHEIGEHLTAIQDVLKPRRQFDRYLDTLHIGKRTARRYMQCFAIGSAHLPPYAMKMAAVRGMDLVGFQPARPFGPYTEAVKKLPVPTIEAAVPEWLDELQRRAGMARKGLHAGRRGLPVEIRLRAAFRSAVGQFSRVKDGQGAPAARKWAVQLLTVLMFEFGLPAQKLTPEAPPEGFRAVLGRPKLKVTLGDGKRA